jgi:alginate O-acetyltransferase complex protein AlgI
MIFNSIVFLVFFALVFFIHWFVLRKNLKYQNLFLLVCSYIFYGWWDWRFLFLILLSSLIDFFVGLQIGKTHNKKRRKFLLFTSLITNLGLLFYFKYYNFFIAEFITMADSLGISVNNFSLSIILPVGISFYTFQTLSYSIDVYKGDLKPTKDIIAFLAFVTFFPQLVAGPIERAKHLLPQFFKEKKFDYETASSGAKLILIGFFKKIVIADKVAILVNAIYNSPTSYPGFPMIVATILFAYQIYCDFSGYSDIAVGTSRLLGFDLMTNFNKPYFSKSISEFWTRWHISLSTWFRDYIYIPMGGNRVSKGKWAFNIMVTFLISGLWHGANWTFVVWGFFHGLLIVIERFTIDLRQKFFRPIIQTSFYSLGSVAVTFGLVCFGWIFFRSNSIPDAFYIIGHMFSDVSDYLNPSAMAVKFRGIGWEPTDLIQVFVFIALLEFFQILDYKGQAWTSLRRWPRIAQWSFYYLLLIIIIFWGTENSAANFIYFQF